jgi:VIT1/CCC1 family predicted Fe2+/Mn2+ transporter
MFMHTTDSLLSMVEPLEPNERITPRLEHEHTLEAIRERLAENASHSYLRDWIYGGIDGAVTTFAVVSGVTGAELGGEIVIILGVANLLADGFSMAASNFAGTRAEREQLEQAAVIERRHIEFAPEGERIEIQEIYRRKGLEGAELDAVVNRITSDHDLWVRTMVTEEYGLPAEIRSPWIAAASTFSAFVLCGMIPLLPYAVGALQPFWWASIFTALVFLAIGASRGHWVGRSRWRLALETLAIGAIASALAYGAGIVLKGIV